MVKLAACLRLIKKSVKQTYFLHAAVYFIYKCINHKESQFEFLYGKTFGYQMKRLPIIDRSSYFTLFIEMHIKDFPHLHIPTSQFNSSRAMGSYYKRLSSFYVGLFSWFNIQFIGHAFKQVFSPPVKVETLDEKACINLFVQEVVMRILKGLRFNLSSVIKFYEIWDTHRVVLKMTNGYQYGALTEQIG